MRDLRRQAWARWQTAAGPWRGWAVCLPLVAPFPLFRPAHDAHPSPPVAALAGDLAESLAEGGTAIAVDLEPVLGVYLAAELNRRGLAHVVLVLPRWPYREAVLPVDGLVAALIGASQQLTAIQAPANVVFVLDGDRSLRLPQRSATDPRADNRYRLSPIDLPNLATLRSAGIRRVLKVAHE